MEFDSKATRDGKFNALLKGANNLGIPSDNIIVSKIDSQYSAFLGADIEKVVEVSSDNKRVE